MLAAIAAPHANDHWCAGTAASRLHPSVRSRPARDSARSVGTEPRERRSAGAPQRHAIVGFSVDTPKRAATAGEPRHHGDDSVRRIAGAGKPAAKSARAHNGISVVDGAISGVLFYWECHRTHTVKPPPSSYAYNPYCRTDENPRINSVKAVVLRDVGKILDSRREAFVRYRLLGARRLGVVGSRERPRAAAESARIDRAKYAGSAGDLRFRRGRRASPGKVHWDPGTAANYSNGGCDIVGWYNYSPFGNRHRNNGKRLDWSMKALLPAMAHSLEKRAGRSPDAALRHRTSVGRFVREEILSARFDARRDARAGEGVLRVRRGATSAGTRGTTAASNRERRRRTTRRPSRAGIADGIKACQAVWKS